jgi:mitotic spindle assembly checkpoint protein MAD2
MDADDGHVVERWVFETRTTEPRYGHPSFNHLLNVTFCGSSATPRDDLQMDREMNAVMKDIISPTYLPTIENPTVFNILVYAHESSTVPEGWDKTHPHGIEEGENDTLKALTAPRHTVSLSVAYRDEE